MEGKSFERACPVIPEPVFKNEDAENSRLYLNGIKNTALEDSGTIH